MIAEENENVKKLRKAYQSWNDTLGESMTEWMDLMDDSIVFRSLAAGAPGLEFTLDCHGKEDMLRYFGGLKADWQMVHYTPAEFISEGDRVVVISTCSFVNRKTQKKMDTPKCDVFRFKNGKIVDFFEFYDTYRCLAAAQ
jgi:ketosteroid isomerase-like protein